VHIVRQRPGRAMTIIRQASEGRGRELVTARWGLVPSWAKDLRIGSSLINARAETVASKLAFRQAFKARRCIIPSDGFYEWQRRADGPKQPYLIRRRDRQPFGFAGLWEVWRDKAVGEEITSCTIITCEANAVLAELHDRMPVILDPADYDRWLDPGVPGAEELLRPCPDDWLEVVAVSTRVNNVRNDDAGLIEPL
jgi:putative SOS response-associated peptidase YedK